MSEDFNSHGQIKVTVDHSAVEMLERKRGDDEKYRADTLEKELNDFRAKDFERRKAQLPEKYQNTVDVNSIDAMEQLAEQEKEIQRSSPKSRPMGTVPMNTNPNHDSRKAYNSEREMYLDLKSREDSGDLQSKAILDKMFEKMLFETKQEGTALKAGRLSDFDSNMGLAEMFNIHANLKRRAGAS